jgi:23S rRNA (guanosine2251-2'-O)-methyltransferase
LIGRRPVRRLFLAAGPAGNRLEAELSAWATDHGQRLPPVHRVDTALLDEKAGSLEHQGVVAEADPYPYADEATILGAAASTDLIIALDRVQDPHNLGAIIRVAAAAGAAVVIPRHRAATVTPAVVKASAGMSERALVAQVRNLTDFLTRAKAAGFWVYGASLASGATYAEADYQRPLVLVVGAEDSGLGHRVEKACDLTLHIPLRGGVESLNVSVAAGILLFEALRQRAAGAASRKADRGPGLEA